MRVSPERWGLFPLLLANAGLAGIIGFAAFWPAPPVWAPRQAASPSLTAPPLAASPLVMNAPPLLARQQAPRSVAPQPVAAPALAQLNVRVAGIVTGPDQAPVAVIEKLDPPQAFVRLSVGGRIGDWALEEVGEKAVVFSKGAERMELRLDPAAGR